MRLSRFSHSIQQLDRLDQHVTWEEWLAIFRSILERTQLPLFEQTSMGVQVLDAMASRGRPYKVLFVLGMNDHVFPRVVREDAFLRDRDRQVLAESLGYKIDEKMTGLMRKPCCSRFSDNLREIRCFSFTSERINMGAHSFHLHCCAITWSVLKLKTLTTSCPFRLDFLNDPVSRLSHLIMPLLKKLDYAPFLMAEH